MTLFEAVVLGLVQGLTEFIPVSSSGHLILARELLGIQTADGLAVDAVLQLATVLAVLVYFRNDLLGLCRTAYSLLRRKEVDAYDRTLLGAIVLGTVPALIAGLYLEELMDTMFRSAILVAWTLILGGVLFLIAEFVSKRFFSSLPEGKPLTIPKGIFIGVFQALALVPGLSRSGMTISGGLLLGLTRVEAARFGFLLSFPIILGSGLKKFAELGFAGSLESLGLSLLVAAIVACVSGIFAIGFLIRFLQHHTLIPFALYRFALAVLVLWFVT